MAKDTTPPNSFVRSPLTPPPTDKVSPSNVSRIINFFDKHCHGYRQGPWTEYSLDLDEYNVLQGQVGKGSNLRKYRKIRYDYEPLKSRLAIRMPTPLHETFCAKVIREIISQLESVAKRGGNGADFAKDINYFASSRIDLPYDSSDDKTSYVRREPDASFGHPKSRYPGVVIEVCYSQKGRRIPALADDYILNSDGSINAVVFLDIEYRGREASFSIWRPCFDEEANELSAACTIEQVFRTTNGLPAESAPLTLKLKDFATENETRGYSDLDQEIKISARDLCCYLDFAEERQEGQEQREGSVKTLPEGTRKRRRAETPPDNINSDDETTFQALEESDTKRVRDSDYRPGSL
ncbi:hypothetical protein BDW75DRAFT_245926 [Aspergillus navahoensis]